jgi:hypothetical protein
MDPVKKAIFMEMFSLESMARARLGGGPVYPDVAEAAAKAAVKATAGPGTANEMPLDPEAEYSENEGWYSDDSERTLPGLLCDPDDDKKDTEHIISKSSSSLVPRSLKRKSTEARKKTLVPHLRVMFGHPEPDSD